MGRLLMSDGVPPWGVADILATSPTRGLLHDCVSRRLPLRRTLSPFPGHVQDT